MYLSLQGVPYIVDDAVEVIATPGHTGSDISVVVTGTDLGTVVIAGRSQQCCFNAWDVLGNAQKLILGGCGRGPTWLELRYPWVRFS